MNTTFIIPGGAGKIVTSIPALEKYHRLNPNDNFKIIVYGWETVYFSNPILQKRVFNGNTKGNFENNIKDNKAVLVEPYSNYYFYNQKCNLIEAFDKVINNTDYHSDLERPSLYLTAAEDEYSKQLINNYKQHTGKNKVVVFQPFGSSVQLINNTPIDNTNRSLNYYTYMRIVHSLSQYAAILYASSPQFKSVEDTYSISFDNEGVYHRVLIGLMNNADYFVGIDSIAQHIAYSLNKPGLVIGGATNDINFSYPNHFKIYRKENRVPVYSPWRVADNEIEFSDRENDGIMDFSEQELDQMIQIMLEGIFNA